MTGRKVRFIGIDGTGKGVALSTEAGTPGETSYFFYLHVTNDPNQLAFCKLVPILPSVTSALDDPFFAAEGPTVENKARALAAKSLRRSRPLVAGLKNVSSVQAILQQMTEEVFLDRKSAVEGLKDAEGRINRALSN